MLSSRAKQLCFWSKEPGMVYAAGKPPPHVGGLPLRFLVWFCLFGLCLWPGRQISPDLSSGRPRAFSDLLVQGYWPSLGTRIEISLAVSWSFPLRAEDEPVDSSRLRVFRAHADRREPRVSPGVCIWVRATSAKLLTDSSGNAEITGPSIARKNGNISEPLIYWRC